MPTTLTDWKPVATTEGLAAEFDRLARQWREETGHLSFAHQYVRHPAYLRIIGMGPPVVPLILRELQATPGQWFVALQAITGADPVPDADRGNVPAMVAAWLDWGRHNGQVT